MHRRTAYTIAFVLAVKAMETVLAVNFVRSTEATWFSGVLELHFGDAARGA